MCRSVFVVVFANLEELFGVVCDNPIDLFLYAPSHPAFFVDRP